MFQVQNKTFLLKKEGIFNLKQVGIEEGFSLYDGRAKQYLCPDHNGNVEVKNDARYLIRKVFSIHKENKGKVGNHGSDNNPFIKFGQDYRTQHPDQKVKVETISEAWNKLDNKTKEEKYGWKNRDAQKKEKINQEKSQENNKKRNIENMETESHKQKSQLPNKFQKMDTDKNKLKISKETKSNSTSVTKLEKEKPSKKQELSTNKKEDDSFGSLFASDSDNNE